MSGTNLDQQGLSHCCFAISDANPTLSQLGTRQGTAWHSRNVVQVHEELQGRAVGDSIPGVGDLHRDTCREEWWAGWSGNGIPSRRHPARVK